MTFKKRPLSADGTKVERRKTRRFAVTIPVEVSWRGADGITVKEDAVARQVNAHGGYLKMSVYPEMGARVTLANFLSAQTAEARVIAAPHAREGVANGIIVELIAANESFWGADLQLEKAILELQNLERVLQSEEIDPRRAKEYQYLLSSIRMSMEAIQQLREGQRRGSDEGERFSALSVERVRRATDLCLELSEDIDAGRLNSESKGLAELFGALEHLCVRLRPDVPASIRVASDPRRKPR
jgi:hypothetical protein